MSGDRERARYNPQNELFEENGVHAGVDDWDCAATVFSGLHGGWWSGRGLRSHLSFVGATGCTQVTQRHTRVTHLVPPLPLTMARLSLLALLALAFSGVTFAAPPASQEIVAVDDVRTTTSWNYADCGMCVFASEMQRTKRNGVM